MPEARYWRIVGVETYSGGDLELSELHLYGAEGRIDTAVPFSATAAPIAGALMDLRDNNTETLCRFAAESVRSGGFSFVWDFGSGNTADAIGVRLGASDTSDVFLAACTLQYSMDGAQWSYLGEFNRYDYPGARQLTRPPKLGDQYYSDLALLLDFDGADGSTAISDYSPSPKAIAVTGNACISTAQQKWGSGSLVISGLDSDLSIGTPVNASDSFTLESWVRLNATDAGGQYRHPIFGQCGGSGDSDQYFGIIYENQPNPLRLQFYRGIGISGATRIDLVGTAIVPRQQWVHCALTYDGVMLRGFLDGVLQFAGWAEAGWIPTANPFRIGRALVRGYESYRQGFQGHLDDVRITKGIARYIGSFAPPGMPFPKVTEGADGTVFVKPLLRVPGPDRSIVAGSSAVSPPSINGGFKSKIACDMEFGGRGTIYGTVEHDHTPANTPLIRRVRLHRSRDGMLVRETWSKADGSYEFTEISGRYEYDVIAWDHEMQFRSVVANNLVPEVMP